MSVLAAAAVAPVKGTQNQLLKAIRSVNTGLVGAASNVKMTVNVASASATLTADEIVVGTALGGQTYKLSGFNKTINLATTGPGGMDAGGGPANGFVALYAIYNPASGASALLATNATLAVMPATYGAAPYPAGYTASALIAVMPTNGSAQFAVAIMQDRAVSYFKNIYNGNPGTIFVPVSASSCVPPNAKTINSNVAIISSGTAGAISAAICSTSGGLGTPGYSTYSSYAPASPVTIVGHFRDIPIFAQQIYIATSGPITNATINCYGYTF